MDPLELTLDEWNTLRNALLWHRNNAVGSPEIGRINKICDWVEGAFHNLSVDTIRLETVGDKDIDPELEDLAEALGNYIDQGPFLED